MSVFYVGSYTGSKPSGIYVCELKDERLFLKNMYELKNATYLTLPRSGNFLYAGLERDCGNGAYDGIVRAYKIGADDELDFINELPIEGNHSCHLSVNDNGLLFAANYSEGFSSVFTLGDDGRLCSLVNTIYHEGSSVNKLRQEKAHPHFAAEAGFSSCGVLGLAVCDLGMDAVFIYKNNPGYSPAEVVYRLDAAPGSGPRHLELYGDFLYVVNELSCDISIHRFTPGGFVFVGRVALCADAVPAPGSSAAAIKISPDGRFLAASLRGMDIISIFSIDGSSGMLKLLSENPTKGKCPRDFSFDPGGKYIVCANQASDNLTLFRFNPKDGSLEELSGLSDIIMPVCVKFRPGGYHGVS